MDKRGSWQCGRAAFTLIELLVVIAIIAILASLFLPAINKAKQRAAAIYCISNQRSVASMLLSYTMDNDNMFPPGYEDPDPDPRVLRYWHRRLLETGYVQHKDAFFCPSWTPRSEKELKEVYGRKWTDMGYTYGLREWGLKGNYTATQNSLKPFTEILSPASFFILGDSILLTEETQGYMIRPRLSQWRVHLRHDNRAQVAFADGHVESQDSDYFMEEDQRSPDLTLSGGFVPWPE